MLSLYNTGQTLRNGYIQGNSAGYLVLAAENSTSGVAFNTNGVTRYLINDATTTIRQDGSTPIVFDVGSTNSLATVNFTAGASLDASGEISFQRTGANAGNFFIGGSAAGAIVFRSNGYGTNATITSSGLNATVIGATTPAAGTFTTLLATDIGTTRVINVKFYGSVGNNSANDTSAIAAAVAALPAAGGTLYFPSGTYLTDTITIASKTGLTIRGDGQGVSVVKGRTGNKVLNVQSTCSNVTITGLTFNGNCSARTTGQQAVVLDCSKLVFSKNEIINSGEYALTIGRNVAVNGFVVSDNRIGLNFADGINVYQSTAGTITGNVVDGPDDDLCAIGASNNITVTGNVFRSRNDLATTWGRGIGILAGSYDINVTGNLVEYVKQSGIYVAAEGGTHPLRIAVIGNTVRNTCLNTGGGSHGVTLYETDHCTVQNNFIDNPSHGNLIELRLPTNLTIKGNTLTMTVNQFCRGIHADEGDNGGSNTWDGLKITNNTINMVGGSSNAEAIHINPVSGVSINYLLVDGNTVEQFPSGNYIYVNRTGATCKVGNNTELRGNTYAHGGTGTAPTTYNNN
jgi:hypothetical protein